jgi:rubrerythrin
MDLVSGRALTRWLAGFRNLVMGVLQTLARLVAEPADEPNAALQDAYVGAVTRARLLARNAERAPQSHSRDALQRLGAAEAAAAARIADVLRSAGCVVAAPTDAPQPPGGLNHWRRMVQLLEAHRAAEQDARELSVRLAEAHPAVATVFDELRAGEQARAQELRALIARADALALD